jgi:prepilin-type N-terminal cleavage/methylation domain-containing protein
MTGVMRKGRPNFRRGFTLIELMVAMALTLFIMVILSQAFIMALDTFSGLKGIGDMQMSLRTALNVLRDDLSQDHFEGKRRLSDHATIITNPPPMVSDPPREGFFVIFQTKIAGLAYSKEGTDADNIPSSSSVGNILYMTVKKRGNRPDAFFTVPTGGIAFQGYTYLSIAQAGEYSFNTNGNTNPSFFSSPWAEVMYFLVQTGSTAELNNSASTAGTPLFALYRAQLVIAPDTTWGNAQNFPSSTRTTNFWNMSCSTPAGTIVFHSPSDLTVPANRSLTPTLPLSPTKVPGASLVMSNVISFDVQVLPTQTGATGQIGNFVHLSDTGFFNAGLSSWVYDSSSLSSLVQPVGMQVSLQAVQVSLRIWDPTSSQARQATLVQDL